MNPNTTLGEVKTHCAEMFERYKDECCENCKFLGLGCCDAPESWNLDSDTPSVPDDDRMTVRKLIAYLSLCNPDYEVCFERNKIERITEYRDITNPDQSYVDLM